MRMSVHGYTDKTVRVEFRLLHQWLGAHQSKTKRKLNDVKFLRLIFQLSLLAFNRFHICNYHFTCDTL